MTKPEVGLSTLYALSGNLNNALSGIARAGVRFIEVVDDGLHALNKRRTSQLLDFGESHNIKYSVHAPFADINIASPSRLIWKATFKRLRSSLENARALNASLWVFHPGMKTGISMFYPGKEWLQNIKTVRLLHKIACDYGLKIGLENVPEPYPFLMKSVKDFKIFYSEVAEDIGLVLDVGHSNINGQTELFIKTFPEKIVHIHAHDNDGKVDSHKGIGHGTINWKGLAGLLREIAYNKIVVVESIKNVEESINALAALF